MTFKRIITCTLFMVGLASLTFITGAAGNISIYSGTGEPGHRDGARQGALFNQPYGIALDNNGSLLVADSYNHCIRRVTWGQVTTVAGSPSAQNAAVPAARGGYADGEARKAKFNRPRDMVADSKGNIFVADTGNHSIRKISGGKVTTFAGSASAGYADGKGAKTAFHSPAGITVDTAGSLYVADTMNHVIRKITPDGEVSTLAGKSSGYGGYKDGAASEALFNEPSDLAFDKNGVLYILDSGNQMVRKLDKGYVYTVAGLMSTPAEGSGYFRGGSADGNVTQARFNFPKGLCITDGGILFIADTWNHSIRAVTPSGKVKTIASPGVGEGQSPSLLFNMPVHLVYAEGNLFVSDMWDHALKTLPVDLALLDREADTAEMPGPVEFEPASDVIQIYVDGKRVVFPDTAPLVLEGKTFVPLRFICETWGATVEWLEETRQAVITKGDYRRVYSYAADPVLESEGRTLVHIRHLAENMGFDVEWIPEYNAAVISTEN